MTPAAPEARGPEAAATPEDEVGRISYWQLVWKELKKKQAAIVGLWCIAGLFVLAVYAPLLASSQPYYFATDEGVTFPLFSSLFNRLLFESSVDVLFNLLFVLSPVYAAAYLGLAKRVRPARLVRVLVGVHFALFLAMAPESFGPVPNPLHGTSRVTNHAARAAELRAQGKRVSAVFPPLPYGYRDTDPARSVEPPGRAHILGTDTEGRDVLVRMLYGTRISLSVGVVAVAIYVSIGVALGAMAGYFGGWVDSVVSRAVEVMICFPSFFLILTLAALVEERSIFHVMVIIGITSWTGVARLVRAEFLKHRSLEYVQAAVALGIPTRRIIFGHILPNALGPVLVTATFGIASAILVESSLAFLGIGDLTVASWGETLNTGRLEGKLWLILAPGAAIFFVVTIFNLVGEGLRDALDPKLRT